MELSKKEMEGERKLYQQKIEAKENKIKEIEQQIANMTMTAQQAGHQVKEIAVKAIEGASVRGNYGG